jgi:prepilin-type N-terminal cleavage/methylation domain-containing protein
MEQYQWFQEVTRVAIWRKSLRRCGFTLIEMLIVITVIAILALLVVPRAMGAQRKAKEAQLRGNLKQLRDGIERFEATSAAWPPALADLMASTGSDISADFDGRGGSVDRMAYDGPYLVTGSGALPPDPFTQTPDWTYDNTTGAVHSSSTLTSISGSAYNTW